MPLEQQPQHKPQGQSTGAVIKRGESVEDVWTLSRDEDALPDQRPAIVPLILWQQHAGSQDLAPWLSSDLELNAELVESLSAAPLVGIDFPSFTDGRGYTLARLLRERHRYTGELRAIGDVLIDQLYYMSRCGFDAMALRDDQDLDTALNALKTFSVSYQPGTDLAEPLFARRQRERVSS